MRLFLADVQQDALDAAVADARSRGAEAVGVRADVSKAEDVDRAAAEAKSAFGAVHSPLAIFAWPVAVLIGVAFGAPVSALSAWAENEIFNPLFRFAITPMFLFSGTFFPVTRLPQGLREVAYATPLWHGVDLVRKLTLGTATVGLSLLHVAYLALWFVVGVALARRAYAGRLVT